MEESQRARAARLDTLAPSDTFSVKVAGVTGATEIGGMRSTDTLRSLQIRIAEQLGGSPEQQRLVLDGEPLREDMMDVIRTLGSYGIVGETALTMMQVNAAKKLRDALQIEADRSLRAAIEPCAEPVRMMLRKASGSDKHLRWFWLTVEDGVRVGLRHQRVSVHWGKRRDGADHFLWRQRRRAPPKQLFVSSIVEPAGEERYGLGLTITAATGDELLLSCDGHQRRTWLGVWRAVKRVRARLEAGFKAVGAGCATVHDVNRNCLSLADRASPDAKHRDGGAPAVRERERAILKPVGAAGQPALSAEAQAALDGQLLVAVEDGDAAAIERLAAEGASPNAQKYGCSAVYWAAWRGRAGAVSALARLGADLDASGGDGLTALMRAAANGEVECVRRLIEAGADRTLRATSGSRKGKTALEIMIVEGRGKAEVVALLRH